MSTYYVEGRAWIPATWGYKALNDITELLNVDLGVKAADAIVVQPGLDYALSTLRSMFSDEEDLEGITRERHLGGLSLFLGEGSQYVALLSILETVAEHYDVRFYARAELEIAWTGDGFPGGAKYLIWRNGSCKVHDIFLSSDHSVPLFTYLLMAIADHGVDLDPDKRLQLEKVASNVRANCNDKDWQDILNVANRLPAHMKYLRDTLNTM